MDTAFGYRVLYTIGFTPWDGDVVPAELRDLVEGPKALTPGRALDIGCGTGTQSIYLARHGWDVTGLDYVAKPLRRARSKAKAARVAPTWVQGDVTQLDALDLSGGYALLLDLGCYHGLAEVERRAYARSVAGVAAPGATFLLMCFVPGKRGPMPSGASRDEVVETFGPDWDLEEAHQGAHMPLPRMLRDAAPTWYRLRRH